MLSAACRSTRLPNRHPSLRLSPDSIASQAQNRPLLHLRRTCSAVEAISSTPSPKRPRTHKHKTEPRVPPVVSATSPRSPPLHLRNLLHHHLVLVISST